MGKNGNKGADEGSMGRQAWGKGGGFFFLGGGGQDKGDFSGVRS